jgi:hypothetical protein
MQRYSQRSNLDQIRAQQVYQEMMRQAAAQADLSRDAWNIQKNGDGELTLLPVGTSEAGFIAGFVTVLDKLLRTENRRLVPDAQTRLRLALHHGPVHAGTANGHAGQAVVAAARLVNALPLKQVLDDFPDAAVALIVSDPIYQDVVRHRYDAVRPERFRAVRVEEKEFADRAWIYIPDEDVTNPALVRPQPSAVPPGTVAGTRTTATGRDDPRETRARDGGGDSYNLRENQFQGPVAFGPGAKAFGQVAGDPDNNRGA